jgi:hypothetical protein
LGLDFDVGDDARGSIVRGLRGSLPGLSEGLVTRRYGWRYLVVGWVHDRERIGPVQTINWGEAVVVIGKNSA